jgi:predicted transcriptional regulator
MVTRLQLEILKLLWSSGGATVQDVQRSLRPRRAPSTVATMLTRLEQKGLVRHTRDGRQYVYRAAVAESQIRRSMVSRLADLAGRLFEGDVPDLVSSLVDAADVSPEDLGEIRRRLEERERMLRDGGDGDRPEPREETR